MRYVDVGVDVGEDVTAHAITLERLHIVRHLEGGIAEDAVVLVGGLGRRIVGSSFWKKMFSPSLPFQITLYFWKCSTNRPVAVTWSPFTTRPVSAVLTVHPTEPGTPWSARQIHRSSRIVLSLLTSRATVALPTCGPPTRKNTSCSAVGWEATLWGTPLLPFFEPICTRTGELTGPASTVMPATSMPGTSPVLRTTFPLAAVRVAMPRPSTTVSARFTLIGESML